MMLQNIVKSTLIFVMLLNHSVSVADQDYRAQLKTHVTPFAFAVVGDGPYGVDREPAYDRLIAAVNRDSEIRPPIRLYARR